MKADAVITVRLNKSVKQQAQKLFLDLGIDMSSAINLFIKQSILHHGLPFKIETPNAITLKAIDEAESGNLSEPFESIPDLMDSLNA